VYSLNSSIVILLLACAFATAHAAAPVPPAARAEIDALMSRLEASACEFNRNGTWHTATQAKAHLLRKLKYLEDQGAVQTAEQFIALAASGSSMTGESYTVRCGNGGPVPSEKWLSSQLRILRSPERAGDAK
jgi:hypothetical protein